MFSLPTIVIIDAINSCDIALLTGKSAALVLTMEDAERLPLLKSPFVAWTA